MSAEERVVRPYLGVQRLQHLLDSVTLRVGPDHLEAGNRSDLTPQAFLTTPVDLQLARDDLSLDELRSGLLSGLEEMDLAPTAVELIAIASTPRLKLAEIVWQHSLADVDTLPTHAHLANAADRPRPLQTPFGGCNLDVYLALTTEQPEAPLRPWRRGTWLGHVRFGIKTDLGEIGFTPEPLTDEVRKRLSLPKEAIRFAEVTDPLAPDQGDDALRFYVDDRLLAELALSPKTAGAKAFQRQLFLDAMAAIINRASRDPDLQQSSLADIEGSLLARLIDRAAPRPGRTSEDEREAKKALLLQEVREQPEIFLARVEAWVGKELQRDLSSTIMGADA